MQSTVIREKIAQDLRLYTNNVERARILSTGNIGVNSAGTASSQIFVVETICLPFLSVCLIINFRNSKFDMRLECFDSKA